MWERRWLELISVYQYELKYRLRKANHVANALSHKAQVGIVEDSSGLDFALFGMQRLLVESSQQEEWFTFMYEVRFLTLRD